MPNFEIDYSKVYKPSKAAIRRVDEMAARHPVGGLIVPEKLTDSMLLGDARGKAAIPQTVDCMDLCLPAKDQGEKPWCAAYAAAAYLENILFRRTHVPQSVDPTWIYEYAKKVDGMPNDPGTTIPAVLQALLAYKCFGENKCQIKTLRTLDHVLMALHQQQACLLGLNVSKEWYACNSKKTAIYAQKGCDKTQVGGHCVLCVGTIRDQGLLLRNSWGDKWGFYGTSIISFDEFRRQFLYGGVVDGVLDGMRL